MAHRRRLILRPTLPYCGVLHVIAGLSTGSLLPLHASAQAWPSKPVRFVVPFAPGGSSEIVARAVAAELTKSLGQSVYIDNKPGGAGNVAMAEVAHADDQHTVILGHIGTLAVNPYIFDKLAVRSLLDEPAFAFEDRKAVARAATLFEGSACGFTDCLVVANLAGRSCEFTATLTAACARCRARGCSDPAAVS